MKKFIRILTNDEVVIVRLDLGDLNRNRAIEDVEAISKDNYSNKNIVSSSRPAPATSLRWLLSWSFPQESRDVNLNRVLTVSQGLVLAQNDSSNGIGDLLGRVRGIPASQWEKEPS
jgi:hypothetical protein